MPIFPHDRRIDPPDEVEIWRFLKLDYFRDLIANEELYFRRVDTYKLDDPNEGLPTDEYVRRTLGLRAYVLDDELQLNHHQGSNRLHSECYYLSCWNIYKPETALRMWYRYAPSGVAVRTTYGLLKAALDGFLDHMHVGQVRYGDQEMTGYNVLQMLYTKRPNYEWENEVRAVLCSYDPVGGQARNYRETSFPHREPQDDLTPIHPWVHVCKRRRIRIHDLLQGIAVSPWASDETFREVRDNWANLRTGGRVPAAHDLKSSFTPTLNELASRGWGRHGDQPRE